MENTAAPLASIVIVTWNSARHLPHCLDCLATQTFQDFEVIVVDNGSTDESVAGLEERHPQFGIKVKRLSSNIGFAAGNNVGARLARGKWLALLNADAFPEPNWLAEFIDASVRYPQAGSFSSRQLQAGNPTILDGAGDVYHISGMAWRIGIGYPADRYGVKPAELFSPCAAAAMYLREAFLKVGGFDEDFFSYFEDVDLGFRLQLHGYRCYYVPEAVVHHVGSSTFGVRSDFAFYHTHRNMIWTFFKDMPSSLFWRYLPAHIFVNVVYVVYYTMLGRGKVLWKAKRDAIRGLSRARAKRLNAENSQKVEPARLKNLMEHGVLKPFFLNRYLRQAWEKTEPLTGRN